MAYSASIGGIATLIGTPPNGIAARFITQTYGTEVTFLDWMAFGLPFTLVFLPLAWLILTRFLFPVSFGEVAGGREMIAAEYAKLGPARPRREGDARRLRGRRLPLDLRRAAARPARSPGLRPLQGLTDSGVAMLAALALFLLPVDREKGIRAMDWETAAKMPWGVLILFGGGLSLAAAVEANGVSAFIGQSDARARRAAAAGAPASRWWR